MKHIFTSLSLLAVIFLAGSAVSAQETQERVIDEVVAQVNEGVITLSRVKREMKMIVDESVKGGKTQAEAQKMVDDRQGELIANLINEELLIQKAKELNLDSQIDASINERFLQIMKQSNLKTLDQLYKSMEESGISPAEIREMWRKQAVRDVVIQREVQQKEYWRPSGKELREYYEKNKTKFTKPETLSVSELYLSFAGKEENAVREKAKQLVAQLRGGADFAKLVAENSDRPDAAKTKGKVAEPLKVADLDEKFAKALKDLKAGGYTDPIEMDQLGMSIIRVDERTAASSESVFDESAVRLAILQERAPNATKDFMALLRKDSYIRIGESYRPIVSPILFAEERKDKAPAGSAAQKNPSK